ncbi:hypothetical protein ACOMHN_053709 [Nucella lapillus]
MNLFNTRNITVPSSVSLLTSSQSVPNNFTNGANYFSTYLPPPLFIPCDNPRNVISPFVSKVVDMVVYVGILPVLTISGTVANIINMLVFARQGLSDRIHLCLFCLSLTDTGYLVSMMGGKSYALISLVDPAMGNYWKQFHVGPVAGLYLSCLAISINITAIISLERCICILSPLKAAKFFKPKYLKMVLAAVALFDIGGVGVSFILKYQVVQVTDPLTSTPTYISRLSPTYLRHRTLIDILHSYLILTMAPIVSLVTVIVCNIAIIVRLKMAANWRRGTASNMATVEKQELNLTRMLVTVCCVYILCMTPFTVLAFLLFLRLPGFLISSYLCNTFKVSLASSHMLVAVNSSINFHIYMRQSSRYRATLREVFPSLVKKDKKKKTETGLRSTGLKD